MVMMHVKVWSSQEEVEEMERILYGDDPNEQMLEKMRPEQIDAFARSVADYFNSCRDWQELLDAFPDLNEDQLHQLIDLVGCY